MVELSALWLPILLSAVFVFIVSSVIHMASPWHKNDYPKLSNEDQVLNGLRALNLPPGDYFVPKAESMDEMRTPEFKKKIDQGPMVLMTVMPKGMMNMSKAMSAWFVYILVVGIFGAYVAGHAVPAGTDYLHVFRFVGTATFLAYAGALWPQSIWYHRSWGITIKMTIDGLLYALVTAGTFGWLWPKM